MSHQPRSSSHDQPWTIRPARPDDAAGIGRVHARSQHATYRDVIPASVLARVTLDEREDWWTRALASHGADWSNLVAEAAGEIVGFACAGPAGMGVGSTLAAYDLYFLYLLPEWERRGLGTALVRATFQALAELGVTQVQILCLRATPARRFYHAIGGRLVEQDEHIEADGTPIAHDIYMFDPRAPLAAP